MNVESIKQYCLSKKGVTAEFPFGEDTMVFKVVGKMFALMDIEDFPLWLNLKCDPEKAIELRERYDAVTPGYHMNKKYWNTIVIDRSIPEREILQWIDESYDLVVSGLKKSELEKLRAL